MFPVVRQKKKRKKSMRDAVFKFLFDIEKRQCAFFFLSTEQQEIYTKTILFILQVG